MKIFVDENIPVMTVRALTELGYDVLDIRGTDAEGSKDDVLWRQAKREGRLFITTDKGFAQYRSESHAGLLIVRLRHPNRQRIHERVLRAVTQFIPEEWPGLLMVVRDNAQSTWRLPERDDA